MTPEIEARKARIQELKAQGLADEEIAIALQPNNGKKRNVEVETRTIVEPNAAEIARHGKPHHAVWGGDLWDAPDKEVVNYIPNLIFSGSLNGLVGPPKGGKTTFVMSKALDYVQYPKAGPILYVTEQSDRCFKAQLKRLPNNMGERLMKARLADGRPAFWLLTPGEHFATPHVVAAFKVETDWDRNLRLWMEDIASLDPAIFILDTFSPYADLKEGGENDSGIMGSRLSNLRKLFLVKPSLGVLCTNHANKKASDKKQYLALADIRGSSAYAGALDHIVLLNRPGGPKARTCYMTVESRLTDGEQFTATFQPDGTYLRGDDGGFTEQAAKIRSIVQGLGGRAHKSMVGTALKLEGDALRKALKRAEDAKAVCLDGECVYISDSQPDTP